MADTTVKTKQEYLGQHPKDQPVQPVKPGTDPLKHVSPYTPSSTSDGKVPRTKDFPVVPGHITQDSLQKPKVGTPAK